MDSSRTPYILTKSNSSTTTGECAGECEVYWVFSLHNHVLILYDVCQKYNILKSLL